MERIERFGWSIGILVVAGALVALAPPSEADTLEATGAEFPSPRWATGAVWDGEQAWVFGGRTSDGSALNEIVRVDPDEGTAEAIGTSLPGDRIWPSAVWTGEAAYVFGGHDNETARDEILRFDPEDRSIEEVAQLPSPRWGTAAVWTGEAAYVFGGNLGGHETNEIVRFDPSTDEVEVVNATLGEDGRRELPAVWTGNQALAFGGEERSRLHDQVFSFDPDEDRVDQPVEDSYGVMVGAGAAWSGERAFVFGGNVIFEDRADVRAYDPATDRFRGMSAGFGHRTTHLTAVWMDEEALVLGGCEGDISCDGPGFREVLRYDPTQHRPTPPVDAQAEAGPDPGEITVTWDPPVHPDNVTGYRLYAGPDAGNLTQVASLGPDAGRFVETGLDEGERRVYTVRAVNAVGASNASEEATARAPRTPGPPQDLTVDPGPLLGELTLDWQAPADPGGLPVDYRIYRHEDDGSTTQVGVADAAGDGFVDGDLGNDTTWTYEVTAVNEIDEGPASDPATGTTPTHPTAPLDLAASPGPGAGEVTLDWAPPEHRWGAETTYNVYRVPEDGDSQLVAGDLEERSYVDDGLEPDRRVTYEVRAENDLGEGPPSDPASTTTPHPPSAPRALAATSGPDRGQVNLSWQAPADRGGIPIDYRVQRVTEDGVETVVELDERTTHVDTGPAPGEQADYRVVAVNDAGSSPASPAAGAEAKVQPRAEDEVEPVVTTRGGPEPDRAVVRSGGQVEFTAGDFAQDVGSRQEVCFDFLRENDRPLEVGETYTVHFRYDPVTGRLAASTDGGETYRECAPRDVNDRGWAGVLDYEAGFYWNEQPGQILVWAGPPDRLIPSQVPGPVG